jgi:DNA repair exonuclease SbcCD ATPase subunit
MLKIDRAKSEAASDVSIDLLKQNIAGIQSNLKDLRKIANEIQADLTERPANKEELQTLIKRQQETVKLINDYETKLKACDTVLKDIQKQKEQTDRAVSEEAAAKKSWKEYQDSLRDLLQGMDYNTFLAELKERLAAEQKRENLTQQIIKIEQEERELPDLNLPPQSVWEDTNSQLTQIQSEITETESQMESRQAIIDVMNKLADRNSDVINAESACPLCGAGPEHWEVNLADLKTQHEKDKSNIAVLRAELNDTKKQIKQLSDAAVAYRETETKRQTLLKQIKNLEISLAELPKRTKPLQTLPALKESIDKTTNLVTDYKLAKTKAQSAEQAASREKDLLLQKQTDYDTAQNDLQELAKTLIGDYQSPESRDVQREKADRVIADAEAGIRQIDDLLHEQAENNGSIREAERQLTEAERKLKEQESLIADSGKIKQWFEYGDKAITWFKKDGLPRLIHRSVLQQLSTIINTELELYDKPFSIEVNDDLTFTASFADGRRVNSRTLSGGQKAMFALSFLSAINRTFLQDIGIMIWDEPTDGLDAINTDFLYDVLERKKKLLHQRGQQLVIITFDEGMIPVFDAVYRIESPQKQTSQQQ